MDYRFIVVLRSYIIYILCAMRGMHIAFHSVCWFFVFAVLNVIYASGVGVVVDGVWVLRANFDHDCD